MSEADEPLTIDVVSDVVCPWCYLGSKRLEAALAEWPGPVAVRWRPYQLDPRLPAGGLDRADYLEAKFGSIARAKSLHDKLTRLGAEVGAVFAFDKITRSPNSLDAHRLICWASSEGVQGKVVDRLFAAYFVEGRDVGDHGVLAEIAGECGLNAELVGKLLAGDADVELVREDIERAKGVGIRGVPFFVFGGTVGVSGAQDSWKLRDAMAQGLAAMRESAAEARAASS